MSYFTLASISQVVFNLLPWTGSPVRPHGVITDPYAFSQYSYDYLVVGGGTSGLILAARLSENPNVTVGVIEAGGSKTPDDPNVDLLINYGMAFGNESYDWTYKSVPQAHLGGRVVSQSTGKILGGSSAICDVLWQRSSAIDYDVWGADLKNGDTWSFKGLLPYFQKAESWSQPPVQLPNAKFSVDLLETHRHDGPMKVGYNNYIPEPIFPYVEAANNLKIRTNSNPDDGDPIGILGPARLVDPATGKRSYTVDGYLEPNLGRPNLVVLTGAQATKLALSAGGGNTPVIARGVEYVSNNETFAVSVAKDVVLAAGTFKTPQLLELSGIGDKALLTELGIESVIDLPGVGENFIDQTAILMDYEAKQGVKTLDQLRLNQSFLHEQATQFAEKHTGVMTYDTPATAHVPLKTIFDASTISALKKSYAKYIEAETKNGLQRAQYEILKSFFDADNAAWLEFLMFSGGGFASPPEGQTPYVTPFSFHLHPLSRGTVHITSPNPLAAPAIDPNYFHSEFDVRMSALSAEYIRKWMNTAPISDILVGPNSPPADLATADDFEEYVRQVAMSTSHPIGTASMAPREWGGVVSPDLTVYGTQNVRVVDASMQPMTIGVAPLATVYAIAEKAADIIKGL